VQRKNTGRDDEVHVSRTLGARGIEQGRLGADVAVGRLRIWIGYLPGMRTGLRVSAIFTYTFSRSLRVKPHLTVFSHRHWGTTYFRGCARPNHTTRQPSGFPIRFGRSPNAAGMARLDCDQRLGRL